MSNFDVVKKLRALTGLSLKDCVAALAAGNNDIEKAKTWLREKGLNNQSSRPTNEGIIECYMHHNSQIGVLVELGSETDFAAKNSEFRQLAKDIALHIAGAHPQWVDEGSIPAEILAEEKRLLTKQALDSGRSAQIIESKIIPGQLAKFFAQNCLLDQAFVLDDKKTIRDLIANVAAMLGETVTVKRFTRFQVGVE